MIYDHQGFDFFTAAQQIIHAFSRDIRDITPPCLGESGLCVSIADGLKSCEQIRRNTHVIAALKITYAGNGVHAASFFTDLAGNEEQVVYIADGIFIQSRNP